MQRSLALIACFSFGCVSQAPPAPVAPPVASERRTIPVPEHLPESVRHLVSQKMENHGFEMSNLLWAVLFLDREVAGEIADSIVEEPRLARPLARDATEINSYLPTEFFDLQDQLSAAAKQLSATAKDPKQPPEALAAQLGAMTQICVHCHSIYLYDPGPEGGKDHD